MQKGRASAGKGDSGPSEARHSVTASRIATARAAGGQDEEPALPLPPLP